MNNGMSPFNAQFTQNEVRLREDLIIKSIVSLINDSQQMLEIVPYFLNYGIIDWSWPLRFVKGNQEYKGFKFYSYDAYEAIRNGERKFKKMRDYAKPIFTMTCRQGGKLVMMRLPATRLLVLGCGRMIANGKLIKIIKTLLHTDEDLDFLLQLNKEDLE